MRTFFWIALLGLLAGTSCQTGPADNNTTTTTDDRQAQHEARAATTPPTIDGLPSDPCWATGEWYPLDQSWLGERPAPADFSGRFKVAWSAQELFVLAEIVDDTLIDIHPDGLKFYWDDDCLEIFVDEDHSGGLHQYNHNAFAYHIALDGRVADIGPDSLEHYYDHHARSGRSTRGDTTYWEVALRIFDDTYQEARPENPTVTLEKGKKLGFAVAYCDNDHSPGRESFIGSVFIPGEDKNRGWIDAGVFGTLILR